MPEELMSLFDSPDLDYETTYKQYGIPRKGN